jgi:hypothetical protein
MSIKYIVTVLAFIFVWGMILLTALCIIYRDKLDGGKYPDKPQNSFFDKNDYDYRSDNYH